jgi:hypothetical protein
MNYFIISVSLGFLFLFNSCSDTSTGPLAPDNSRLTLIISRDDAPFQYYKMNVLTSFAFYDTTSNHTTCVFIASSDSIPGEVIIKYGAKRSGFYSWIGTATVSINMSSQSSQGPTEIWSSTSSGGTQVLTEGTKGDEVIGSFSGYFVCNMPTQKDSIFIEGYFETTVLQ